MLTPSEVACVLEDIGPQIEGSTLERLSHPATDHYVLHLARERGGAALLLSLHPRFPRLHLTRLAKKRPADSPGEALEVLRRELTDATLQRCVAREGDRLVTISFLSPAGKKRRLVLELFRPAPNLILVDDAGRILAVHKTPKRSSRPMEPGQTYELPPVHEGKEPESLYGAKPEDEGWSAWIDRRAHELETADLREELLRRSRQKLTRAIDRLARKESKLAAELEATDSAAAWRQRGELLLANLYRLKRGAERVTVEDYYHDGESVELILDPAQTPQQNAERYFKKARKLEQGRSHVEGHLAATGDEIAVLQARLAALEELDLETLEALAGPPPAVVQRKKKEEPAESEPRRFVSKDGLPIFVGRNDRQNHELTIRRAKGNDLWLHIDQAPGSHVVVPIPKGQEPPPETLLDAAQLALYYSKVRGSKRHAVMYTRRKFIRHPKGAPLGRVTVSQEKRLEIGEDRERLGRLIGMDRFDR
ncbi:MAG: NFACT family protein [Planctomycetota bacterium]